jgi:choline dehydrogenase-like flavoprotein
LNGLLEMLSTRRGALLASGRPIRLTDASQDAQDRFLRAWQAHPSAALRGGFQAVRRLILWTWWESPEPRNAIGWLGPLHLRQPHFGWEGPLPGSAGARDPTLRIAEGSARFAIDATREPASAAGSPLLLDGGTLRADVCVIGSGAGGSVIAERLARAGMDVIVLEAGPAWKPSDSDEEESTMVSRLYAEGGTRATDDQAITLLQGACLGGGTTVNWMLMLRPPGHVMDEWERDWRIELLGPGLLLPALSRIEAEVSASPVPADGHNAQNHALLEGARTLGWRVEEAAINAKNCIRAGTCGLGCRWGAKQSATETFLPSALRHGARVVCGARATRIDAPLAGGERRRVHFEYHDGTKAAVRVVDARTVVLAAGAIGTPALLQRSNLGGGGVGRFLRLHPTTAVVGLYGRDMYGGAGIPQSAVCTEFLDEGDGFGYWIECPPFQPALAAAALPGFGASHAERMRDYRKLGAFIVLVRDGTPAAHDRSQGSVRVTRRDELSIEYTLRPAEWSRVSRGIAASARMHLAAGATRAMGLYDHAEWVGTDGAARALGTRRHGRNRIALFSAHVNGTCRLGTDARESGCDPDGRRHGVHNVYVADGSILPSAPAANPQATIMAVASLIAERIPR